MTQYRAFPSLSGPEASTSYTGPLIQGMLFEVTSACYLDGYWYWRADGSQGAAPSWALWQATGDAAGVLVPNSSVSQSGGLTGQWNYVALPTPIPLSINVPYKIVYGQANNFSQFQNYFSTGAGEAGITEGPLFVYSDSAGSAPDAFSDNQDTFSTGTSNPAAGYPGTANSAYNACIDLTADTSAPANSSYQLWPNYPEPIGATINSQTIDYTLGTQFSVSETADLTAIAFYSPPGATELPTRISIWQITGESRVIDNQSPSWSGAAGSGWVTAAITGTLTAGVNYVATVYYTGGVEWFVAQAGYWGGTGQGTSGFTYGILTAPNNAGSVNGQGCYNVGDGFPASTAGENENYYVTPVVNAAPAPPASSSGGDDELPVLLAARGLL